MIMGSALEIVGGIGLIGTGVGGPWGMMLIGMGGSSLISGVMNKANEGSFFAGWIGGQVSGFFSGLVPIYGPASGAFLSSITTDWIDRGYKNINWGKAGWSAGVAGVLDIVPGLIMDGLGKELYKSISTQLFLSYRGVLTGIINGVFNSKYGK